MKQKRPSVEFVVLLGEAHGDVSLLASSDVAKETVCGFVQPENT